MIDGAHHLIAVQEATRFGIEPRWVLGMIEVESSGEPDAWNPEPKYRYLWDIAQGKPFRKLTEAEQASEIPPTDFPGPRGLDRDAEWWGQQASWGLMQVMGAVARELGYKGRHLPALCRPEIGIPIGCRHLANQIRRFGNLDNGIAAYNAGTPRLEDPKVKQYVDSVIEAGLGFPRSA